jgi:hypothetical protein
MDLQQQMLLYSSLNQAALQLQSQVQSLYPLMQLLSVIDKTNSFYLEEGDNIEAGASANGDLTITISYEDIS